MATDTPSTAHDQRVRCRSCDRVTLHSVTIEIRTEAADSENARFSREPYRVTECLDCGRERAVRMNDVPSV